MNRKTNSHPPSRKVSMKPCVQTRELGSILKGSPVPKRGSKKNILLLSRNAVRQEDAECLFSKETGRFMLRTITKVIPGDPQGEWKKEGKRQ